MKKISNFLLLFISEITILLIIVFIIPAIFLDKINEDNESGQYTFLPLENNLQYTFSQKITHPNLEKISFLFKNPNIISKEPITITINNQEFLITGASIGDPSWVPFKFAPINNNLTIQIKSNNKFKDTLFIAKNKENDTLVFKSEYKIIGAKNRFISNLNFQIQKLSQNISFLSFYLLLIFGLNYLYVQKK
mgnify:CR=1 FL=1